MAKETFEAPCEDKDPEHPSFWECKLKANPHYLGAADEVCVGAHLKNGSFWWLESEKFCFHERVGGRASVGERVNEGE